MDRSMWQDHLVQVSKLFVQHTKLFMHRNGVRDTPDSSGPSPAKKHHIVPRTRQLDGYDSDFEGTRHASVM